MSEKQWVAKLKFKVSAHQEETLMGQSWLGKAPEMADPKCLLLLYLHMFAVAIFLWHLAQLNWVWGDSLLPVIQCGYLMETSLSPGYFYLWIKDLFLNCTL